MVTWVPGYSDCTASAITCAACSGVSVTLPLNGLVKGLLKTMITGAFSSGVDGPWKCAAVAVPLSPAWVTFQVSRRVAVSYVTSAEPVARVGTGGTSFAGD